MFGSESMKAISNVPLRDKLMRLYDYYINKSSVKFKLSNITDTEHGNYMNKMHDICNRACQNIPLTKRDLLFCNKIYKLMQASK